MRDRKTVTVAIDDNILLKDHCSTAGSKILGHFTPPFNAAVIDKIQEADGFEIRQSLPNEFGVSLTDPFGSVRAVADGEAGLGIGCDATGAIRNRAAESGVCFLKPTYGTVSRFGLVSTAPSLEQIGVVCGGRGGSVEDGFDLLAKIAGFDERDGTLAEQRAYAYAAGEDGARGLRVAVPDTWAADLSAVTRLLEESGARVETVSLPLLDLVPAIAYSVLCAETSNSLSRFDGIKFGYRTENAPNLEALYVNTRSECFTPETKILTLAGIYVLTKERFEPVFRQSLKLRRRLKEEMDALFAAYDCVALPAGTITAEPAETDWSFEAFRAAYQALQYSALPNLIGAPALALPCGKEMDAGFPGVQFTAKPFDESALLRIGKWFEVNRHANGKDRISKEVTR